MKINFLKSLVMLIASGVFATWALASQAVNVNTASAEEIAEALTGIGPSKAEAIVEYREKNGKFKHVDELVNVSGIGISTVDSIREYVQLENSTKLTASK